MVEDTASQAIVMDPVNTEVSYDRFWNQVVLVAFGF